jgi:hypothetical protein
MKARPSLHLITAAVLLTGLTAVASAAQNNNGANSSNGQHSARNNNNQHNAQNNDNRNNGPPNRAVSVPEPSMSVLLVTGLIVLGVAGWRKRRKL